jgi:hypothetical protein
VGKTYKDLRKFDTKRNKEASRNTFKETDLRTRVKPVQNREKGGANNWRNKIEVNNDN